MSDLAIQVEGLSKCYRIGSHQEQNKTLRETISDAVMKPFSRIGNMFHSARTNSSDIDNIIWALNDVSFEIKSGEAVGIIGSNGAGKSTLLKILSRITEPTTGVIDIYGHVGSLLEVGTGFHPELTGRENIFLNGVILGMKRKNIEKKFDEIVSFAEVEKFIDTPVKRYSSGMYLRLAFSVAAHLDPGILIIDEVLAVGDAAFQKKCLGKMQDVTNEGKTVLFVSHNMATIRKLCQNAILLEHGNIHFYGETKKCIDSYLHGVYKESLATVNTSSYTRSCQIDPNSGIRIMEARLHTCNNLAFIKTGEELTFSVEFECTKHIEEMALVLSVLSLDDQVLFQCNSESSSAPLRQLNSGNYSLTCSIKPNPLSAGQYKLNIGVRGQSYALDFIKDVIQFTVEDVKEYSSFRLERTTAIFTVDSNWHPLSRLSAE